MQPDRGHLFIAIAVALVISFIHVVWGSVGKHVVADCVSCDAGWYQQIASEGYRTAAVGADLGHWHGTDVHQTEWAFFPLYPWLLRAFSMVTGLGIPAVMLLLGGILSCLVAVLAMYFFSFLKSPDMALWGTLALLLQPFGIYFHLGMTEGLFLAALLGSFLSVAKRSWIGLAICATTLVLTRPNGLFLLPVFLLFAAEVDGVDLLSSLKRPGYWIKRAAPLLFPVMAFAAYCVFQWQRTGDAFAFSSAQAGWARSFTWPFEGFFNGGDIATQFDSWYTLVLLAALVLLRKRLPLSFNVLLGISVLLPLFSGSVASMPRFTTILFPLFLLAGEWLATSRWRYPVLAFSFAAQLFWFSLWLNGALITC